MPTSIAFSYTKTSQTGVVFTSVFTSAINSLEPAGRARMVPALIVIFVPFLSLPVALILADYSKIVDP